MHPSDYTDTIFLIIGLATYLINRLWCSENRFEYDSYRNIYRIIQTSKAEGMQTMEQSLIELCREGKIDYEVAQPYIKGYSKFEFIQLVNN